MEESIHKVCLDCLLKELKPFIANHLEVQSYQIFQVLSEAIQNGKTYSLQFSIKNKNAIENFEVAYNESIASKLFTQFKDKIIDFRTILEEVKSV